jgi:acetyl-CoA carboxylase biotin carboxyl carrier protein
MKLNEIQDLINLVNKSNNLAEFTMKDGEFSITIRTAKYQKGRTVQVAAPVQSAAPAATTAPQSIAAPTVSAPVAKAEVAETTASNTSASTNYIEIKSPMVGTFYRSAGPDKAAFVKVGDTVEPGKVVCMIEAMKLFNEIECEVKGKVVKIMVDDASPVEYDQVLYLVEP